VKFWGEKFEGSGWVSELKVPERALPIPLFRLCCCTTHRLVTMHSITDGQRDNVTMPIADHTACSTIGQKAPVGNKFVAKSVIDMHMGRLHRYSGQNALVSAAQLGKTIILSKYYIAGATILTLFPVLKWRKLLL